MTTSPCAWKHRAQKNDRNLARRPKALHGTAKLFRRCMLGRAYGTTGTTGIIPGVFGGRTEHTEHTKVSGTGVRSIQEHECSVRY